MTDQQPAATPTQASTMGEAVFEIHNYEPDLCDYGGCERVAKLEVGLIGSPVHHLYVCRNISHKSWAKDDLVERHLKRQAAARGAADGRQGG